MPIVATAGGVTVRELSGTAPLAFAEADPAAPLPIQLHGGGVDVDVSGCTAGRLVINFLCYPQMHAEFDGQPVVCTEDAWQRVVVDLPGPGQVLHLRFRSPWGQGLFLGAAVVLLGLFLGRLILRATPKVDPGPR